MGGTGGGSGSVAACIVGASVTGRGAGELGAGIAGYKLHAACQSAVHAGGIPSFAQPPVMGTALIGIESHAGC